MNFEFPHRALLAAVPWLAAGVLAAQEPPAAETFSETVDVHVVNVEVVVTGADQRPVGGLTRDDFELYEDGRRMELSNFFAVDGPLPEGGAAASGAGVPRAEPRQVPPEDRTRYLRLVVFVDNVNIRPENRKLLFDRLREHLTATEGPRRLVSVVAMSDQLEVALPFTEDLGRVHEVLAKLEKKTSFEALYDGERRMLMSRLQNSSLRRYSPARGGGLVAEGDPAFTDAVRVALEMVSNVRSLSERRVQKVQSSIQALGELCGSLGGLPGRKALLYLSDGLSQRPGDTLLQAWIDKFDRWVQQNENDIIEHTPFRDAPREFQQLTSTLVSNDFDVRWELDELARQANASRVTLYPISNSGRINEYVTAGSVGTGIVTSNGSMSSDSEIVEVFTREASLLHMAEDTGGIAMLKNADVSALLDRMQQDFDSYYSLGYSPPHGGEGYDYHKLEIKVLRPGLEVRYAEGYRNKTWRERLGEMTFAAALYGVESNPLGVRLDRSGETTRDGKRYRVPLLIKIPFELIRMVHKDEHFNAQLTVLVMVQDQDDGGVSKTRRFDFPIKVPDERVLETMVQVATYPLELEMNKGRKKVVIGVRDHLAEADATVTYDLVVGDG